MIKKINSFFDNFEALATLFLRLGIGIAFIIHGYGKFPLPPEGLVDYYDLHPFIESLVANGIESSSLHQNINADQSIFKVLLGPMVEDESTQKMKIQLENIGIIDYRVIIN